MPLNIPMPKPSGEILGELPGILNAITQNRLKQRELDFTEPLRKAQAEQALANASKSQMLSKLMGSAFGGDNLISGKNNNVTGKTDFSSSNSLGNQNAKQLLQALGYLKETPAEQQIREIETAKQKSLIGAKGSAAGETLKSTAKSALGSLGVNASFNALDKLMNHPNYQNIAGTMEGKLINSQFMGIPTGSMLQRNFPEKFSAEDANLAGQVEAQFGNIVTNVAERFKGPFKDMVRGVINTMKPNMGDSLAVQKGKIQTLKQLSKLADQQELLISKYVNSGIDPTEAILKSSQELQPNFVNVISKSKVENVSNNNEIKPSKPKESIIVLYKDGKEYHMPPKLLQKALSEGFTLGD